MNVERGLNLGQYGYRAVTLNASSVCNLKCAYCFQPKVPSVMYRNNEKTKEWLRSGKFIEDILYVFGDQIEDLTFWGGEPSINFPLITPWMDRVFKSFPKLKHIFYSTNISTERLAQNTVDLIKTIEDCKKRLNRKLDFQIQFSLDGPENLNKRVGVTSRELVDNISYVLKNAGTTDCLMFLKPTHDIDNIRWLSDMDNLISYYQFFDDCYSEWEQYSSNYPTGGEICTFVAPGNYTQEDGRVFEKYTKNYYDEYFLNYKFKHKMGRFNQISKWVKGVTYKLPGSITAEFMGNIYGCTGCSAGLYNLGLDCNGYIHICHDTFFFDPETVSVCSSDDYSLSAFEEVYGYPFSNFWDHIYNKAIMNISEPVKLIRMLSVVKDMARSIATRAQYYHLLINELARSGQINERYLNPHYGTLAEAFFMFGGTNCVINNLWQYGRREEI